MRDLSTLCSRCQRHPRNAGAILCTLCTDSYNRLLDRYPDPDGTPSGEDVTQQHSTTNPERTST